MDLKVRRFVQALALFIIGFACAGVTSAQNPGGTLSGVVTDASGTAVAGAIVSAKNAASGQIASARTDSAGRYSIAGLAPGDYDVTVTADSFNAFTAKVTMVAGTPVSQNVTLSSGLSLGDLGFAPSQTQGSAQDQARLDKRSHMLQVHQRLGLITTGPLVATVILGTRAGGRTTSSTDRDVHAALGSATVALYGATAYYAIFAPKIAGTHPRGQIRFHKAMMWIHGPGMILTPILGEMAFSQKSKGEHVHGIASAHGAVGIVTAAAYGAAILSVSVKF